MSEFIILYPTCFLVEEYIDLETAWCENPDAEEILELV